MLNCTDTGNAYKDDDGDHNQGWPYIRVSSRGLCEPSRIEADSPVPRVPVLEGEVRSTGAKNGLLRDLQGAPTDGDAKCETKRIGVGTPWRAVSHHDARGAAADSADAAAAASVAAPDAAVPAAAAAAAAASAVGVDAVTDADTHAHAHAHADTDAGAGAADADVADVDATDADDDDDEMVMMIVMRLALSISAFSKENYVHLGSYSESLIVCMTGLQGGYPWGGKFLQVRTSGRQIERAMDSDFFQYLDPFGQENLSVSIIFYPTKSDLFQKSPLPIDPASPAPLLLRTLAEGDPLRTSRAETFLVKFTPLEGTPQPGRRPTHR